MSKGTQIPFQRDIDKVKKILVKVKSGKEITQQEAKSLENFEYLFGEVEGKEIEEDD
jgi:hypothetical protein